MACITCMNLGSLLKYLRDVQGLSVPGQWVHAAIRDGKLTTPPKESGRYEFGSAHVDEIVKLRTKRKERSKDAG